MHDDAAWVCPTCKQVVSAEYCPTCGERRLRPRDLTLRGLLAQVAQSITNLDARLIRTVRCLVGHPGELTVRYLQGPRKPYIGPFAFFLLTNVLFVAMEALTKSNVFSTPLAHHMENQPWSPWARGFVPHRLAEMHTTLAAYTPVFDAAVARNAQSFVALMVLPFALAPALVFRRTHRPFVAHVAFSLHFHAFMLLLLSVSLAVPAFDLAMGGRGLESQVLDNTLAAAHLAICAIYLGVAIGPVYGARGIARLLQAIVLVVAAMATFLGYRFVLLLVTLYTA
jgi:hypothetical protein